MQDETVFPQTYYLIRHGETDANKSGILQGHLDTPLSEMGRRQAECVGQALAGVSLDAVFSSDLSRAVETSRAILKHQRCRLVLDPRLREIHCGLFQGKTMDEARAAWPEAFERLKQRPLTEPRPGGESYGDLDRRVRQAFASIAGASFRNRTVAIVTHGGVVRCILAYVRGAAVDPSTPAAANCSISVVTLEVSREWVVLKENHVEHLRLLGGPDPRKKAMMYSW